MQLVTVDGSEGVDIEFFALLLAQRLELNCLNAHTLGVIPSAGAVVAYGGDFFRDEEAVKLFLTTDREVGGPESAFTLCVAGELPRRVVGSAARLCRTMFARQKGETAWLLT